MTATAPPVERSKPLPLLMWLGCWLVLALGWTAFAVHYWLIASPAGELTDEGLVWRFIAVPIGLLAGVFVLRWIVNVRREARERRAAAAAARAEAEALEAQAAATRRAAEIRHRSVAVFGYALASKLGDAQATADALAEQASAVELDASFGLAGIDRILTGRIDPLEAVSTFEDGAIAAIGGALDPSVRLHRIAILLDRALADLTRMVELLEDQPLKVNLLLASGASAVPPEVFQPLFAAIWRAHAWANHPAQFAFPVDTSVYAMIDAYIERAGGDPNLALELYLATDSWMDADLLDGLASRRELQAGKTVGLVPGEAAAALLIGPAHRAQPGNGASLTPCVRLRRPKIIEHASRNGRRPAPDAAPLPQTVIAALEHAEQGADSLAAVCCDADARAGRTAEVAAMMTRALPTLEPIQDQRTPIAALGHCGAAAGLVPIVLACAQTQAREQPTVAVSVSEERLSAAVVIQPFAAPPAEAS